MDLRSAPGRAFGGTELADPSNVTLGHKSVPRWNLPDGWVISNRPAHQALVSEDDFIAAQDINAARGPAPQDAPVLRRYLLAGLLACGMCGRRMESAWSNGKAAYRCRHGRISAMAPDPARPKNAYIREDKLLPHLPALARRSVGRAQVHMAPASGAGLICLAWTRGRVHRSDGPAVRAIPQPENGMAVTIVEEARPVTGGVDTHDTGSSRTAAAAPANQPR